MTDRIQQLLEEARTDAMRDVRPPGTDEVRRTVRRRRGSAAVTGAAAAVAAMAAGFALAAPPPAGDSSVAGEPSATASDFPVMPAPDAAVQQRMEAAWTALGDREATPWVMATNGGVTADYENHVNDIPAGTYDLLVNCVGAGTVDAVVKAGDAGDVKLAAGTVTCADQPTAARLTVNQPVDGYLRVFLSGDRQAADSAAFSFKFVRVEAAVTADPETTANAIAAAELLGESATGVTTERDKTVEKPLPAGRYTVTFGCKGPGALAFTVRSAAVLRDGTVATDGRIEDSVDPVCSSVQNTSIGVPVTLPAGSAITITAAADPAARNKVGWAYTIKPA